MFRSTHIRTKLAAALAVPLAALVAVAGFEVYAAKQDVDDTGAQTQLATASVGPGSLAVHLQNERNRTSLDLIGLDTDLPVANKDEARPPVDDAATAFRAELSDQGSTVEAAFASAWQAYADLDALRAEVDAFTGPQDLSNDEFANEVFTRYTTIIEAFFDATSQVALSVDDADLRNGVEIVDAATRQGEMRARIVRSLVLGVVTGTSTTPAVRQEVAALYDRSQGFDDAIRSSSHGPYAGVGEVTFAEPGVQSFNSQVEAFLADEPVDLAAILDSVKTAPDIGYTGLRDRAADRLLTEADAVEADAIARQRLFGALAAGVLLAALLVTWLASRSITRPLRSLRDQANEMAGTTLPAAVRQILDTPAGEDVVIPEIDPIRVKTRDEVAEVATALSAVQTSALDLAVEQAVLRRNISDSYINLGRRNQNLLSRQLDFITELERNEGDPDTLDGLFRLDHLATRMRRNAESLLVLAGIEPPRQWSAPVKASDVVRAALGEVEDYQRVIVRNLEPASVTGSAAADIAHVLAELLENALSFSPPDQSVEVKGRLTTGGYTFAIADNGLGMTADELERANRRLAGHESFTVAPSRYLGHYVAGHLASRLGIVVELQDSPAGGITARVDVPMALLADEELDPRIDGGVSVTARPSAPSAPEQSEAQVVADPAPAAPAVTASGLPRRSVTAPAPPPVPQDPEVTEVTAAAATPGPAPAPSFEPEPWTTAAPAPQPSASAARRPAHMASDEPRDEAPIVERDARWWEQPATDQAEDQEPEAPSTSSTAAERGFGGLAMAGPSMHTIAAQSARGATTSGLTRRVPGAQRPDVSFGGLGRTDEAPTPEVTRSSPDDVYSFLSSFQSGVARGRADAHGESTEDER